jgi:hypothetical protein
MIVFAWSEPAAVDVHARIASNDHPGKRLNNMIQPPKVTASHPFRPSVIENGKK